MDYDEICIKAYDNKDSVIELNKLWDYVVRHRFEYNTNQINYLNFMFNTYGAEAIRKELARMNEIQKTVEAMQYKNKEYNPLYHESKKALTVKNPYAEWIAQGKKKIEVRSKNTKHRGELVICSSAAPEIQGMQSGCTLAIVNLYKTKPITELTPEEWEQTCIPKEERKGLTGYGWFLNDVVRIVEYPVKGQLGIWTLVMDKYEFVPYSSEQVADIPVNLGKRKYNKKAVKTGCMVISFIFVVLVAVMIFILSLIF